MLFWLNININMKYKKTSFYKWFSTTRFDYLTLFLEILFFIGGFVFRYYRETNFPLYHPLMITFFCLFSSIFVLKLVLYYLVFNYKVKENGNILCGQVGFGSQKNVYRFNLSDVKQIVYLRLYPDNSNIFLPSDFRGRIFNGATEDINLTRRQDFESVIYSLNKKVLFTSTGIRRPFSDKYCEDFVHDGLDHPYNVGYTYVLFLSKELNKFEFDDFHFTLYSFFISNYTKKKDNFLLGLTMYNEKFMEKIYSKIKVNNVVLSYPNIVSEIKKYDGAVTQDLSNRSFYDINMLDYFEYREQFKKIKFYKYITDKFKDQHFEFVGEIKNEKTI